MCLFASSRHLCLDIFLVIVILGETFMFGDLTPAWFFFREMLMVNRLI
jgi:hypothetical protein